MRTYTYTIRILFSAASIIVAWAFLFIPTTPRGISCWPSMIASILFLVMAQYAKVKPL